MPQKRLIKTKFTRHFIFLSKDENRRPTSRSVQMAAAPEAATSQRGFMLYAGRQAGRQRQTLPKNLVFNYLLILSLSLSFSISVSLALSVLRLFLQPASYGKKNGMWYASPGNQGWGSKPASRKPSIMEADLGTLSTTSGSIKRSAGRVIRIINNLDHSVQVSRGECNANIQLHIHMHRDTFIHIHTCMFCTPNIAAVGQKFKTQFTRLTQLEKPLPQHSDVEDLNTD